MFDQMTLLDTSSAISSPASGDGRDGEDAGRTEGSRSLAAYSAARGLEHTESDRRQQGRAESGRWGAAGGCAWSDYVWIPCADGKARRIEPGLEPLVDGLPGRAGLLRGYGNAIVPRLAAQFIEACEEARRIVDLI